MSDPNSVPSTRGGGAPQPSKNFWFANKNKFLQTLDIASSEEYIRPLFLKTITLIQEDVTDKSV